MPRTLVNPADLARPRGYSHGVLASPCDRVLFLAGQVGWDREEKFVSDDIPGQFARALANIRSVLAGAGGRMQDIVQMRIYVTDLAGYRARLRELGRIWRGHFGDYYPAMTLVRVHSLFDEGALVEIESVAVLPPGGGSP